MRERDAKPVGAPDFHQDKGFYSRNITAPYPAVSAAGRSDGKGETDMPEIKEAAEKAAQKAKARKRRVFVEVTLLSFLVCMLGWLMRHF